jgi:hypothetical protein
MVSAVLIPLCRNRKLDVIVLLQKTCQKCATHTFPYKGTPIRLSPPMEVIKNRSAGEKRDGGDGLRVL